MSQNKKRVAWISYPDLISTDRFIIPLLCNDYIIDWFLIAKTYEKIDFLSQIEEMALNKDFNLHIIRVKERNFEPKILFTYYKLLKRMKQNNYDLFFLIMMAPPFFMPLWFLLMGRSNTIVGIHNLVVPKGARFRWIEESYTFFTILTFKYFHTFSSIQCKSFEEKYPNKKIGYSNFILMDYGRSDLKPDKDIITFLSFGYIREYKRIDVLIQAAQKAYESTGIRFKVLIAGSCDNWEKYSRLIRYNDLFDLKIRRIEEKEVSDLFAVSNYFVAPYQDIAQSGSSIIALNYNIPIIASNLPAFSEYIKNGVNGFIIKPADINDLCRVIIYILNNNERIIDSLKNNIEETKNSFFSPTNICKMYQKSFNNVLQRK